MHGAWWNNLIARLLTPSRHTGPSAASRFHPSVEVLEDRTVLSAVTAHGLQALHPAITSLVLPVSVAAVATLQRSVVPVTVSRLTSSATHPVVPSALNANAARTPGAPRPSAISLSGGGRQEVVAGERAEAEETIPPTQHRRPGLEEIRGVPAESIQPPAPSAPPAPPVQSSEDNAAPLAPPKPCTPAEDVWGRLFLDEPPAVLGADAAWLPQARTPSGPGPNARPLPSDGLAGDNLALQAADPENDYLASLALGLAALALTPVERDKAARLREPHECAPLA